MATQRKAKIPKTVTILGRRFTVKSGLSEEQFRAHAPELSEPGISGATGYSQKLILIRAHEYPEEDLVTFFHECFHAMQHIVGLNQITNPDVAEVWCESGANAMMDILRSMK